MFVNPRPMTAWTASEHLAACREAGGFAEKVFHARHAGRLAFEAGARIEDCPFDAEVSEADARLADAWRFHWNVAAAADRERLGLCSPAADPWWRAL